MAASASRVRKVLEKGNPTVLINTNCKALFPLDKTEHWTLTVSSFNSVSSSIASIAICFMSLSGDSCAHVLMNILDELSS
jgi:hypothetical protein